MVLIWLPALPSQRAPDLDGRSRLAVVEQVQAVGGVVQDGRVLDDPVPAGGPGADAVAVAAGRLGPAAAWAGRRARSRRSRSTRPSSAERSACPSWSSSPSHRSPSQPTQPLPAMRTSSTVQSVSRPACTPAAARPWMFRWCRWTSAESSA